MVNSTKTKTFAVDKTEGRMAGLISLENFFPAIAGEKQLEIDFPHDQYFRKIGVYLRLILAGILMGYSFSTSVTCYPPGLMKQKPLRNQWINQTDNAKMSSRSNLEERS